MSSPRRHARRATLGLACLALLAAGLAGTLGGASPANGAGYHLCDGYAGCEAKGMGNAGYAKVNHKMYWRMYTGHNCTNYAAYRMIQAGMPNERPWSGGGNATYWGQYMSRITDQTPRVGAIAWYRSGGPGHVAYVEKVVSKDEIIISQDSWGGDFSWARVTKSYGWPTGFIHFVDTTMATTAKPRFNGATRVGGTIRAVSPGKFEPAPDDVSYQWKLGSAKIPGATDASLVMTPEMLGKRLNLEVTASKRGYETARTSAVGTTKVLAGRFANPGKPLLEGEPEVDSTLRVPMLGLTPRAEKVSYQWKVDGEPVAGATTRRFAVGPYRVGRTISVAVRATREAYTTLDQTIELAEPVQKADFDVTATTALSGLAVPGNDLTLEPGTVAQTGERRIQWLRGGKPVPGATDLTYRVTRRDVGTPVAARVSWTRRGYNTEVHQLRTRVVKAGVRFATTKERVNNGVVFGLDLRSGGAPWTGTVNVRARGERIAEIAVRDGKARVRVTDMPRGWRTVRFVIPSTDRSLHKVAVRRAWFR